MHKAKTARGDQGQDAHQPEMHCLENSLTDLGSESAINISAIPETPSTWDGLIDAIAGIGNADDYLIPEERASMW